MSERLGDESGFFRVMQLKSGVIQFTDSTNASKFLKEHGKTVRYFPSWKKWLVWNGTHWETDEGGSLVHEKGLETVRGLYDEGNSKNTIWKK